MSDRRTMATPPTRPRRAVLLLGAALALLLGLGLTTISAGTEEVEQPQIDCPSAENPALTDLGRLRHLAYCIWKIDNPAGSYWEFSRSDDFPMPGRSILRWQASRTPGSGGFFVSYESSQQQNQGDRGTYQTQQQEQRQDEQQQGERQQQQEDEQQGEEGSQTGTKFEDLPEVIQEFIKAYSEGGEQPEGVTLCNDPSCPKVVVHSTTWTRPDGTKKTIHHNNK